jgi:hypothetical protein
MVCLFVALAFRLRFFAVLHLDPPAFLAPGTNDGKLDLCQFTRQTE